MSFCSIKKRPQNGSASSAAALSYVASFVSWSNPRSSRSRSKRFLMVYIIFVYGSTS
ncbi:hypothetical protein PVAP13_1KG385710 [Panicum virgatum]|uniref:Uncharacterized protein n=1 Tax=Panicum virgatum TaxID=38727 RepID=A0A8T0XDE3_PANVG|nr:hypothetical protein PVAP13_1KG385710 [Panicum virgatum]